MKVIFYEHVLEVNILDEKKKGQITIIQKKKKREIIEERGKAVNVPSDVSDEKKKALQQAGDDATQGW